MFPCLSEMLDNRAWLVSWCVSIETLRLVTAAAHMQIERGGDVRQICLNSYYITSGAQRRADNIYFYPGVLYQMSRSRVTQSLWGHTPGGC